MAQKKGSDSTELSAISFYLGVDTQDEDFDKAVQKLNEFKNSFQDLQKDTKLTLDTGTFGTTVTALVNALKGLAELYDRAERLSAKITAKDADDAWGVYTPRQVQAMYRTEVNSYWNQFGGSAEAQKESIRNIIQARARLLQHGAQSDDTFIALNQIARRTGDQSLAGNSLANLFEKEDYETVIQKLLTVAQQAAYNGDEVTLAELRRTNLLSEGDFSAMVAAGTIQREAGQAFVPMAALYRGAGANISPAEALARSQQEYAALMAAQGNAESKSQLDRSRSDLATVVTATFAPLRQALNEKISRGLDSAGILGASLGILDAFPAQAAQRALENGILSNQALIPPDASFPQFVKELASMEGLDPEVKEALEEVFSKNAALGSSALDMVKQIYKTSREKAGFAVEMVNGMFGSNPALGIDPVEFASYLKSMAGDVAKSGILDKILDKGKSLAGGAGAGIAKGLTSAANSTLNLFRSFDPDLVEKVVDVYNKSTEAGDAMLKAVKMAYDKSGGKKLLKNTKEGLMQAADLMIQQPLLAQYGLGQYQQLVAGGADEADINAIMLQKTGLGANAWKYFPTVKEQEQFMKDSGWHDSFGNYALAGINDEFGKQSRLQYVLEHSNDAWERLGAVIALSEVATELPTNQGYLDATALWGLASSAAMGTKNPEEMAKAIYQDIATAGGELDYDPTKDMAVYDVFEQLRSRGTYGGEAINIEELDKAFTYMAKSRAGDEGLQATGVLTSRMDINWRNHNVIINNVSTEGTVTLAPQAN